MLITPCIIRTLYLLNKFILHQHYIAKVLFHYTCCGAGRGVCQGVVDNVWYRTSECWIVCLTHGIGACV